MSSLCNDRLNEKQTLFQNFKLIIEKILSQHSHDVWSVHGGLQSLVYSLDAIFQHGVKPQTGLIGVVIDYWLFVRGLRWLDPTQSSFIDNLSKLSAASPIKPQRASSLHSTNRNRFQLTHGQQWIEKCLMDRSISKQMITLLSDVNHLKEHYHDWSILRDELFTSAILTCIAALEQNSPALLANIPSSLFVRRTSSRSNLRMHRSASASASDLPIFSITENLHKAALTSSFVPPDKQSASDPLNVGTQPGLISAKQIKFEHRPKSSSLTLPQSENGLEAVSSCKASTDHSKQVMAVGSDAKETLRERLLRSHSKAASEGDASALSNEHKPLFCDSDEDDNDCVPDGLDFILTRTSEFPNPDTQMNVFYSTIDTTVNIDQTVLTGATNPDEEISTLQSISSNLPDLVISAEVSRSSKMTPAQNNAVDKTSHIATTSDEKQSKSFRKVSSFHHHRRSRSDQTTLLTSTKNEFEEDAFADGPFRNEMKPSSTFSCARSLTFNQRSQESSSFSRSTSLMNYLKSQDLTTCADIDKENAHFDFSEILIGAIEQMKCQLQADRVRNSSARSTSQSEDPTQLLASESYKSPVGSFISVEAASPGALLSRSGLPTDNDRSSALSYVEDRRISSVSSESSSKPDNTKTAESIAIGLLQAFSGYQRETTNDFDWLISEEDVPQKLLPLPKSTVVDPDFSNDQGIRIRGNQDWAPPRPQIIFNAPTKLKLKVAMAKQNNRCAGCGTYVEKEFMKRFRYCEYTGKFFCTCCHDNKLAVLPANVLQKFDFTKYKVSNFSYDLLMKIASDPLFNIGDINPSLYKKAKHLASIRDLRIQMLSLYNYLQLCRFATAASEHHEDGIKAAISSMLPSHILTDDPHVYSLNDLEQSKSGELLEQLKSAVALASNHVTTCELCRSKGYLCEICHSDDLLFPHLSNTSRCDYCKSCFHKSCFVASSCPRCARLRKRRRVLEQISEE